MFAYENTPLDFLCINVGHDFKAKKRIENIPPPPTIGPKSALAAHKIHTGSSVTPDAAPTTPR